MNSPDLGFDPARLQSFLQAQGWALQGPMRLTRIGGGQSNPTFFVDCDNRSMVLRKQPVGDILPSAHAVDREYRVMKALSVTDVPVPQMLLFRAERDVVGTPFYLMEKLQGRVFSEYALPGIPPEERRALYFAMADAMARLHRADWRSIGLADYGRPGSYFERQINRWSRQWQSSKTQANPALERLIEWLPRHVPASDVTTLCHGDLRMGNVMFHPTEARVIGILDWELSTLGHPLADVAYNTLAWRTLPSEYGGILGLDHAELGIPSVEEYLDHYLRQMGDSAVAPEPFHYVFSLFRFAVIFEGIAARAAAGNAVSDNAAEVGRLGFSLAQRAVEILDSL